DHFLSLCPTELTVDLLEERLTAAEKSILAVGASRGDRRTTFFEGRSGLRLPLVRDTATARARGVRVVDGMEGAVAEAVEEEEGLEVEVGVVQGVGASVAAVAVVEAAAEVVEAAAAVVEAAAAVEKVAVAVVLVEVQPCSVEALVVASASSSRVPVRPRRPSSFVSGTLGVGCAGESALSGTAPTEALHTFTLDSDALRSFFRDSTTLTPLIRLVAVSLADPSGGPVLAHSSTVLPCPAALSSLLSGLHLPSFSTNLVSGADLQDAWVDQYALGGQRVTHCTCSRTGRHLATFTRRPGSSLYTLTTAPPPVAASSQVFAAASRSSPASAPCSCRPLTHETLLWHHRLGHPSLPHLRGMASRTLVSGLPRYLPPLPPGPAPTCIPCVEGRQRAASHSSSFPPTEVPLQTLHMDVERFSSDLPILHLHSDRGGEFSSHFLRAFCRAEGIRQTFTLPASPQQNGIAEHRIGMVMDVALRCALAQPSASCLFAGDHTYSEVDGK
ncbi:unnamed protein product, partial [Closterium sp. NIES-53]